MDGGFVFASPKVKGDTMTYEVGEEGNISTMIFQETKVIYIEPVVEYHKSENWIMRQNMEIKYRPVQKEDAYEWYTLLDEVWRDAYGHIFPKEVFDGRDYAREERVNGFTEDKYVGERKIAYVAECDGKIVGLIFGTLDTDYEYFKNGYADLTALYVYPEYQGKGIGTALRDIFTEWAKTKRQTNTS